VIIGPFDASAGAAIELEHQSLLNEAPAQLNVSLEVCTTCLVLCLLATRWLRMMAGLDLVGF
jgi:hypothetical protein